MWSIVPSPMWGSSVKHSTCPPCWTDQPILQNSFVQYVLLHHPFFFFKTALTAGTVPSPVPVMKVPWPVSIHTLLMESSFCLSKKKESSVQSQYLRLDQTETETLFGSVCLSKPKSEVHTESQLYSIINMGYVPLTTFAFYGVVKCVGVIKCTYFTTP